MSVTTVANIAKSRGFGSGLLRCASAQPAKKRPACSSLHRRLSERSEPKPRTPRMSVTTVADIAKSRGFGSGLLRCASAQPAARLN